MTSPSFPLSRLRLLQAVLTRFPALLIAGSFLAGGSVHSGAPASSNERHGANAAPTPRLDMKKLEGELATSGLTGWIHGAVDGQSLYVFTYRDPEDFFTSIELPLIARSEALQKTLRSLHRHDRVRVKGRFLPNSAPLRHLLVSDLEVLERWKGEGAGAD